MITNSPEQWQQEANRFLLTNPIQSCFAFGHYYLLLDNATECFNNYLKGVFSILTDQNVTKKISITNEISTINKLHTSNPILKDQVIQLLTISAYLATGLPERNSSIVHSEFWEIPKKAFKTPVIIVAGGASLMDETKTETYRDYFRKMFLGFKGTVISGGTDTGIPGLIGEVKAELQSNSKIDFDLTAYLPVKLPDDIAKSQAYDYFHETNSDHFSVTEVLNYWFDLVYSGIHPSDVKLTGIDGGAISAFEYRIALSFGAKVVLMADSGRAASDLIIDKFWMNHPNLFRIQFG